MKKFIYPIIVFLLGFILGNYDFLIKQADASYCNCDYYDFKYDVEKAIKNKISKYDYDFKRAVKNIVEDCSVDSYGDISCW